MNRATEAKDQLAIHGDAEVSTSPDGARREGDKSIEDKAATLVAADLSAVPRTASWSGLLMAGLALSVLLHVGVLVYLQRHNTDDGGSGGTQLQTVEIDLITASDWLAGARNQGVNEGADADDDVKKDKSEAARREPSETPPEGFVKPAEGTSELAAAEIIKADPIIERREEEADREKPEKAAVSETPNDGEATQTQEAHENRFKSGSSLGATPGQITRYGLSVREALNRNRPLYFGADGRVVVEFWVAESGGVQRVRIAQSSGLKDLDDAAIRSIQKTQFPAPPNGMTEEQRAFRVPFDFRLRR
jgi:TonB family protein